MDPAEAIRKIIREYKRASEMNGAFHTAHEGYAVILEELDELKAEVWKKRSKRSPQRMTKEATQVAAMAFRFMVDLL